MATPSLPGSDPTAIHSSERAWVLETSRSAYAFGVNQRGQVVHRYWGPKLPLHSDYPPAQDSLGWASFNGPGQLELHEYPVYGGTNYNEPSLKASFADGVRDLVLEFVGSQSSAEEVRVFLKDSHYSLEVILHYRVHAALDLIERRVEILNRGDQSVTLERALSATWHLPRQDEHHLRYLTGRWFEEFQLCQERLEPGVKVLESRRITTGHQHNPWFAVHDGQASETHGAVYFGCLEWSGNWRLNAELNNFYSARIGIGLNDWDFALRLLPGETFITPAALAGFSAEGFGGASQRLHQYARGLLPHGEATHKVIYNSWEATTFYVDEASQVRLAKLAAAMGVELFVMDDGWFNGRNSDNAGLGDWYPDAKKFPQGLQPLIKAVNDLGMEFGLWLEPEMVNPNSELYRAHPDWVIHFPNRERTELRQQLILNLARLEVQDYLIAALDKLLSENNIGFIKWDMNRNVSEPGWLEHPEPRELWVRYVEGLYRVWGTLRQRHPSITWQSCSGGGGRADFGMLRLADQIWTSDNTEPTMRLRIQEGFSQLFPACTMEAWVTDSGPKYLPLEFRFHVSMTGVLGVGGHLEHWNEAERQQATQLITDYKNVRHIVHSGTQYRLRSSFTSAVSAVQYLSVDRSEGVLFMFRTHLPEPAYLPRLYPRGLDPEALYSIEGETELRSGTAWMTLGLECDLVDFESSLRRITRVNPG